MQHEVEEDLEQGAHNGWIEVKDELLQRLSNPLMHVTFFVYLLVGVVLCGGLGIWIELYKFVNSGSPSGGKDGLLIAMLTFPPALVGASTLQLIFGDETPKSMRSLSLLLAVLFAVVSLVAALNSQSAWGGLIWVAAFSCLFAIAVWWVANGNDLSLLDGPPPPPNASTGGETDQVLSGNLSKFKH